MSQSIFEKISDKILETRTRLLETHSEEEVEKFLLQAYTLASLKVWDKYVDVFSEEDFNTLKSNMNSMSEESNEESQNIKSLLEKYNISGSEVEEGLLNNLDNILNSQK